MKNAITAFGFCVCIILCFVIHSIITTKDVSANEAEKTLNTAIEQGLSTMTIKPIYSVDDIDALITELGGNIQSQLSSDSELAIFLVDADWIDGTYELAFVQTINLSNGNKNTVTVKKTIHTENYIPDENHEEETE